MFRSDHELSQSPTCICHGTNVNQFVKFQKGGEETRKHHDIVAQTGQLFFVVITGVVVVALAFVRAIPPPSIAEICYIFDMLLQKMRSDLLRTSELCERPKPNLEFKQSSRTMHYHRIGYTVRLRSSGGMCTAN